MIKLAVFIAIALLAGSCSFVRRSDIEFPKREVSVDGQSYGYRIYVPAERPAGAKPAVMLYLHGSNRRGSDNEAQVQDLADLIRTYPDNFPYIIVFPQCRENTFWAGPMMKQAIAALDQTVAEFGADERKIYLAGYSMGCYGVWQTAITYPNKFAALVSVAGGIEPTGPVSAEDRALLSPEVLAAADSSDPYRAYAEGLAKIPAWIVHGADDKVVRIDGSRKLVAALRSAGNPELNYSELPGVGHDSLRVPFSDERLSKWLKKRLTGVSAK
jgi:predicted peptidase